MNKLLSDPNLWTALGTWFLVVGTLIAVYLQTRQNRLINSANTIITFHDRFESYQFKKKRQEIAQMLINSEMVIPEDLLVFFETIGCLTRRGVLTKEMIWNEFSWETIRYYNAFTNNNGINYIGKLREDSEDVTLYADFEWLYKKFIEIDKRKRKVSMATIVPSSQVINAFLKEEAALKEAD
jgi:hypothetical protein